MLQQPSLPPSAEPNHAANQAVQLCHHLPQYTSLAYLSKLGYLLLLLVMMYKEGFASYGLMPFFLPKGHEPKSARRLLKKSTQNHFVLENVGKGFHIYSLNPSSIHQH